MVCQIQEVLDKQSLPPSAPPPVAALGNSMKEKTQKMKETEETKETQETKAIDETEQTKETQEAKETKEEKCCCLQCLQSCLQCLRSCCVIM
jgi:hypothetical protein